MTKMMTQYAPFPNDLENIVNHLRYRPGWRFSLVDDERDPASTHGASAGGLTFIVTTRTYNAYQPGTWAEAPYYSVNHYFIVPAATFNRASWLRWVFDCLVRVETHEAMEFFALEYDGGVPEGAPEDASGVEIQHPFAPTHGPGDDPYVIHEYASDTQARTSFRGEVKQ